MAWVPAGSFLFTGFGNAATKFTNTSGAALTGPPGLWPGQSNSFFHGAQQDPLSGKWFTNSSTNSSPFYFGEVWDKDWNHLGGVGSGAFSSGLSVYADHGYTVGNLPASAYGIRQFDASGTTATWDLTGCFASITGVNSASISIAPDGSFALIGTSSGGGSGIIKVALPAGTYSTLIAKVADGPSAIQGILALQDGTIVVAWKGVGGFVGQYDASGALLQTYTLPDANSNAFASLSIGSNESYFNCTWYDTDSSITHVSRIQTSDGTLLSHFTISNSSFSYDGPFAQVFVATGTPPDTTPCVGKFVGAYRTAGLVYVFFFDEFGNTIKTNHISGVPSEVFFGPERIAQVASSGKFMLTSENNIGSDNILFLNAGATEVVASAEYAGGTTDGNVCGEASPNSSSFWSFYRNGGSTTLNKYNGSTGALIDGFPIGGNGTDCMAINFAGSICYSAESGDDRIFKTNLPGSTSAFVIDGSGDGVEGGGGKTMMCLPDGALVVAWRGNITLPPSTKLRCYETDGSLRWEIEWPAPAVGRFSFFADLWLGANPSGDFWALLYDDAGTPHPTLRIFTVNQATGAKVQQFVKGDDDEWGTFCHFTLVGCAVDPIDTPMPNPTTPAPQTDCTPQTQVSGGGIGNAGCNTGGVGWVSSYSGPYGTVPQHPDPSDGESLADKIQLDVWFELTHTDYPSGEITVYRRSFKELGDDPDYEGGRKPEGLKSVGDIEHGLANEQGRLEAASCDIHYADQVDRLFRELLDTQDLENDPIYIKAASPEARANGDDPAILMRAVVTKPITDSPMDAGVTAVDVLFAEFGPFGPGAKWPVYRFKDLGAAAPNLPADIAEKPIPVLWGEKSDEGATDPATGAVNPKGLNPGYFIGMFNLPSDIIPVTPTPGRPFDELVAAFEASAAGGNLVADFGGTDPGQFGHDDMVNLQAYYDAGGGIPNWLDGLAAAKGVDPLGTLFNGVGYSDIAAWQGLSDTTNTPGAWGFICFTLRPPFRYINLYGSDLGGGNPNNKHDRAVIANLAGRQDILCPGYNWPFATLYTPFLNPVTGQMFWLSGIWVRGPLLDDHINGVVNFTANLIGNEDIGDGTGLPIIKACDVWQDWLDNHVLPTTSWSSGALATNSTCPKWPDGTPIVRSSTFTAWQDFTAAKLPTLGLTVGWWSGERQRGILEVCTEWMFSTEAKMGFDKHGGIILFGLDTTVDPTDWPRVDHVVDIFGSVTRSSGEERENVCVGTCDWDPDGQKFRVAPITRKSDYGIGMYKGHEKQGDQLDSTILNIESQMVWVLSQRVIRLAIGTTLYDIDGNIGLQDRKVATGLLLTTIEGTGQSGFVNRPMYVTRSKLSFERRISTLTLWDMQNVLIATRFPNGLLRMPRVTNGSGKIPVTNTADMTALVLNL